MNLLNKLLFPVLAFSATGLNAATRTVSEAQVVANKTLSNSAVVSLTGVKVAGGDTLYYTFNGSAGGYVVVAADAQSPALLAYSKNFPSTGIPAELQAMLDCYAKNGERLYSEVGASSASGLKATHITDAAIEPLMPTIVWGQRAPFNNLCPEFDGTNSPTGCVATAVSQILRFYHHPVATLDEIPAYTTKTNKIDRPAVAKGTVIDWKNMLDSYEDGYTSAQAEAVAQLMNIVGTAVTMDYKADAGATDKTCVAELVNIFGYDPDLIRLSYRSSFTLKEWYDIIYNELKAGRPVLFSGSTMKGGHRFVCDGIDNNGLFHINWGWNGNYNGYYDLTLLNPNTTTEAGASTSTDGYSGENYIVYGIVPDNGKADPQKEGPLVEALTVKHQVTAGTHYLFYSYANPSLKNVEIQLASGYIDADGKVVKVGNIGRTQLEPNKKYTMPTAYGLDVTKFKEGQRYKVGLIESTDGDNWTPVEGFTNVSVDFVVKDGDLLVAGDYKLDAELQIVNFNYVKQYAYGKILLTNAGDKEYYRPLYLMTNSVDVNPMKYSYAAYVTAEAGSDNVIDFKFIPQSETVYYWIMDADNKLVKNGVFAKGNDVYKLVASASIDTLSNGERVCLLNLTNEGKAYYDNIVRISLFCGGSYTTISSSVCLKDGESTTLKLPIDNDTDFTHYGVYDYMADQFAYANFGERPDVEGDVELNVSVDAFIKVGDVLLGNLVVSNNTSAVHKAVYNFEIDTIGQYEGKLFYSKEIEVEPHTVGTIPFKIETDRDSFYLVFYQEGADVKYSMRMEAEVKAACGVVDAFLGDLNVWAEDGCLVAEANADVLLSVVGVNGSVVTNRQLCKGECYRAALPAGIYVANGRKVVIR